MRKTACCLIRACGRRALDVARGAGAAVPGTAPSHLRHGKGTAGRDLHGGARKASSARTDCTIYCHAPVWTSSLGHVPRVGAVGG